MILAHNFICNCILLVFYRVCYCAELILNLYRLFRFVLTCSYVFVIEPVTVELLRDIRDVLISIRPGSRPGSANRSERDSKESSVSSVGNLAEGVLRVVEMEDSSKTELEELVMNPQSRK